MTYPSDLVARDRFVVERRGARPLHDPWRHQGVFVEEEPAGAGERVAVATLFLTGRECPWRCVMCDLWRHTTEAATPPGAIPRQIADACDELSSGGHPLPPHLKLYNAGSFFDAHAVPPSDDGAIAELLDPFQRVIVESHPALVGDRTWRFRDRLAARRPAFAEGRLEVAMGLETAHPEGLERLHKRVTLEGFAGAAADLAAHGLGLRVFVLVSPPFVPQAEQDDWLRRSIAFAFASGASVVSLIPTRPGNGALEALAADALFVPPRLCDLERSHALALGMASGRVLADLWDLERFAECPHCLDARRERLRRMNLAQGVEPACACRCGGSAA